MQNNSEVQDFYVWRRINKDWMDLEVEQPSN